MDGSIMPARDAAPLSLAAPPGPRRSRRRLLLAAAALAVLAGGGWYGKYWWTTGRYLESTDDAYTQADAVSIAPRVSGYVSAVSVADNQAVHAGQVLARIDDRDYRAALDQARADVAASEADLASVDAQLESQQSTIAQARSDIDSADAGLRFAQADFRRYTDLMRTGNGTVQRAEQAESDIRQRQAALAHAQAALESATRQIAVLKAARARDEAALLHAQAAERQAELNVGYTVVTAPVDGAVGDRSLRLGQYVQPGTQVMDVVPTGRDIYVTANFKETQLARMWRGESADVTLDMFSGVTVKGHVDSLAPGSGAQFALLPPENATGNFTKIVQRVPVRIVLDVRDPGLLAQLRPGLSAVATVDTRTRPEGPAQTLVGEGAPAPVASLK